MPKEDTQFKKGQSGNPNGRPALPPELKAITALTKEEVNRLLAKYARLTYAELLVLKEQKKLPAMEMWIVSGVLKGIEQGNWINFDQMLNRTIGKVKDEVEVSTPEPFIIRKPDGSVVLGTKSKDEDE